VSKPDAPADDDVGGAAAERDGERERWNRRYAERGVAALQGPPAEWLVENQDMLVGPPGRRALDVACGN